MVNGRAGPGDQFSLKPSRRLSHLFSGEGEDHAFKFLRAESLFQGDLCCRVQFPTEGRLSAAQAMGLSTTRLQLAGTLRCTCTGVPGAHKRLAAPWALPAECLSSYPAPGRALPARVSGIFLPCLRGQDGRAQAPAGFPGHGIRWHGIRWPGIHGTHCDYLIGFQVSKGFSLLGCAFCCPWHRGSAQAGTLESQITWACEASSLTQGI